MDASHVGARSAWTPATRAVLFYAAMACALVITMAKLLRFVLPEGLAAELGNYGESFLWVVVVCAAVQVVGRHRPPSARSWTVAAAFAALCLVLTVALHNSDLPPGVRTLTEPLLAGGIAALYINLPRPVRWPVAYSLAILAVTVVFFDSTLVFQQSEAVGCLLLTPIALDVVDRSLLDPDQPNRPFLRIGWCIGLAALAVCALLLAHEARPDLTSPYEHAVDYAHRAAEAYWGWIIIHLYLGFWLPWRGVSDGSGHARDGSARAMSA